MFEVHIDWILSKKEGRKPKNERRDRSRDKYKESEDKLDDESPTLSFAQLEGRCYCCGKQGHKSPDCYLKDKIPREEWAIKKTQMATIREEETANSKEEEKEPEQHIGWAGVHYMFAQNKTRQNLEQDFKKLILLDSDSNTTISVRENMSQKYGMLRNAWE